MRVFRRAVQAISVAAITAAAAAGAVAAAGGLGTADSPAAGSSPAPATAPAAGSSPAAATAPAAASGPATAAPGASVFYRGTDSNYISIPGRAPFREPGIGGSYGGYIGMAGNWAAWMHCGGRNVWSVTDAARARTNLARYHTGIGTADYWFMAGPGVDPHYNGTTKEAAAWGAAQAARTLSDIRSQDPRPSYPVVFMDVELPGHAPSYTPAADNGWNAVYTSPCSGKVKASYIAPSVDRADFNGFAHYLTSHSPYKAGVYSAPSVWASIFGSGTDARITNVYEWTYAGDTSSLSHPPSGWCLTGTRTCAHFFGGITSTSKYALMWQWTGGGGTYNGYGDLDQIDGSRTP